MSKTSPQLKQAPRFAVDAHGKPTVVTMDMAACVTLLIKANAIDLALWPPGMEKEAEALARVRQIESDYRIIYTIGDAAGEILIHRVGTDAMFMKLESAGINSCLPVQSRNPVSTVYFLLDLTPRCSEFSCRLHRA